MGVFEFVTKNSKSLAVLDINGEGGIVLKMHDFDFSYAGLEVEAIHAGLRFKVSVPPFELVTDFDRHDLKNAAVYLTRISDADLRREVIKAIENDFLTEFREDRDTAGEHLRDAQKEFAVEDKLYNDFLEGMRQLKANWGIV